MYNMVIIIARSQGGEGQGFGTAKATLTCERSGRYRLSKNAIPVDVEKFTGTKKMLCPFRLEAREHVGGGWSVFVRHGVHNHKLPPFNEGRAKIGRLNKQELSLVQELKELHHAFSSMPAVLDYVHSQWIEPYRDRFVRSYTMHALHFGTRTTNRVESAHAALKCWLKSSTGSLDTIWPKIHSFLELQIREIKATMQRSQNNDPHVTALRIFMLLKGQITHKALRLLDNEYKRVGEIGEDGDGCGCYMRHTHGLPCAHVMREMEADGRSIQLSDIHPFWKTLDVKASSSQKNSSEGFQFECQHDIDKVLHSFFLNILEQPEERKKIIAAEIEKMITPEFTTLKEPPINEHPRGRPKSKASTKRDPSAWEYSEQKCSKKVKGLSNSQEQSFSTSSGRARGRPRKTVVDSQSPVNSQGQSSTVDNCSRGRGRGRGHGHGRGRGRGRSSEITSESATKIPSNILPFVDELPSYIISSIHNIHNVDGDGNCGYRVVAHWIYEDEHRWPTIRQELGFEIEKRLY
ncbi:hypothetical protein RDABS01_022777 [Bienertia sinuspersici]